MIHLDVLPHGALAIVEALKEGEAARRDLAREYLSKARDLPEGNPDAFILNTRARQLIGDAELMDTTLIEIIKQLQYC